MALSKQWYQDLSHPKIHIVGAQGTAESLDAVLEHFKSNDLDVSPKMDKGSWHLIIVNQYGEEPVSLQLSQDHTPDKRGLHTEIVSAGIGEQVIHLAEQTAELSNFKPISLKSKFIAQIKLEQDLFKMMYDRLAHAFPQRAAKLYSESLRAQQQKYHSFLGNPRQN